MVEAPPTPRGLFSIVDVWRWNPADFLGAYILPITAHATCSRSSAAAAVASVSTAAAARACSIR